MYKKKKQAALIAPPDRANDPLHNRRGVEIFGPALSLCLANRNFSRLPRLLFLASELGSEVPWPRIT
jgi:hypothetical protein